MEKKVGGGRKEERIYLSLVVLANRNQINFNLSQLDIIIFILINNTTPYLIGSLINYIINI